MKTFARLEFAADRRATSDKAIEQLLPAVESALTNYGQENWWRPLLRPTRLLFNDILEQDSGGDVTRAVREWAALAKMISATLPKTGEPGPSTATMLATWLSTAAINAAASAAADRDPEGLLIEWVTMHDNEVRPAHAATDGQQRPPGEPFDVDGYPMAYPGDPSAPIELWINCRCMVQPVLASEAQALIQPEQAASMDPKEKVGTMTVTQTEPEQAPAIMPLAWHGVLVPEGVWSGDGRRFAPDSLRFRDLPLPLTWQKISDDGHKGSVTVARIDGIERVGNLMQASGVFLATPEADEVVGLIAEFGQFGVSIDADDGEFDFDEESGRVTFTSARIASASIVAIPAFAEAFVALGTWAQSMPTDGPPAPADDDEDEDCGQPGDPGYDDCIAKQKADQDQAPETTTQSLSSFVSDTPWSNFSQSDYSDAQWTSACVLDKGADAGTAKQRYGLPIKEPGGALNRNGVHAAASRFNQVQASPEAKSAAASKLRSAYSTLGEDPPDAIKAAAHTFDRGPGWITNPEPTKRIHDYWTVPGEPGYEKVGWGTDGDFARCKVEIGQEIAEEDPETVAKYMNQICAQWHHDATGFWPGHAPAERLGGQAAPAVSLVASSARPVADSTWFTDPGLEGPTPLTITDDGRVFGHLATWGTCHLGFGNACVTAPHSATGYAYFLTGAVRTEAGSVPVGQITMDTGHAPTSLRMRPALSHYDNTGTVVADVACGEDEHGIWLAGRMRPGADADALLAAAISGDWREVGAGRDPELIAALAVNSPGFPVPRVGFNDGVQVSLVAAGALQRGRVDISFGADTEAFADAVAAALARIDSRRDRMAALAARVGGSDGL